MTFAGLKLSVFPGGELQKRSLLYQEFPSLNGLRGVFLIWVLFVHSPDSAIPKILETIHAHWILGVDGFLAISGFLVTRSLQQCADRAETLGEGRSFAVWDFLSRRFARIIPPYYFILGIIVILALVTRSGLHQELLAAWKSSLGFPLFFANYSIPMAANRVPAMLQPYWSISFQEQFYLLLAIAFLFVREISQLKVFLWIAGLLSVLFRLLGVVWFWKGQHRGWEYEANLHLAFDSMSWGCLVWIHYEDLQVFWKTRLRTCLSNTAIGVSLIAAVGARSYWFGPDSMAILSIIRAPVLALTIRMICEMDHRGLFSKFLQSKPLQELGRLSYEVYLVHPIFYAFFSKYQLQLGLSFLLFAVPMVVVAGGIFHTFFGRPLQRWIRRYQTFSVNWGPVVLKTFSKQNLT